MNFWRKIKKPILVLAPMADVTDSAFRRIIAKYGKPDVMYTEFVSADGLLLGGESKLLKDLEYSESERPIVAQFFTSNPEHMEQATRKAQELGFDGVDINMGCPVKKIIGQGAGSDLIKNPKLAQELVEAAKRGAGDLPVSVKTRVGYNKVEIETWLPALLEAKPEAIIIHARTKKEMSKVPANWDHIKRAVEIRYELKSDTLILGNGDVENLEQARVLAKETGADGVMIGRGIFGNPWLFSEKKDISVEEKLNVMLEHTKLFEELLDGVKNFAVMKKHYKAYVNGFDGAKELRAELMMSENSEEISHIIQHFLGLDK